MKIILLASLLIMNAQYAKSQEFTIIKNHPNEWQIPETCSAEITTRIDDDKAETDCTKVIFSTSTKTHNINFVVTARTMVTFVTEIGSNNKTLNVNAVVLWSEDKTTMLDAEGKCLLINKGENLSKNKVASIDMIGCTAETDELTFRNIAGFTTLESKTAINMFR